MPYNACALSAHVHCTTADWISLSALKWHGRNNIRLSIFNFTSMWGFSWIKELALFFIKVIDFGR